MSSTPYRESDRDETTQHFVGQVDSTIDSPPDVIEDYLFHDSSSRHRTRTTENVRGISEEYMAMTKACIHDHDYFSVERRDPYPPRNEPASDGLPNNFVVQQTEVGKSGVEVKSEIHRRIRSRRIIRKSTIVTNTGPQVVKPFPSPTKAGVKQTLIIRNCVDEVDLKVPCPRPSITPFPPVEKGCRRVYDEKKVQRSDEILGNQHSLDDNPTCNTSADSAYESLTLSSSSQQRSSTSRPPSGGKRSAAGGISSSSSSDFSSDELSDVERPVQSTLTAGQDADNSENTSFTVLNQKSRQEAMMAARSRHVTRSGRKIRKHIPQSEDSPPLIQEQKLSQYIPTPPPVKPKKGRNFRSVPMRLRALPTSFWEEPNQANNTMYTILPPVMPLLQQHEDGDISEIAPVSPVTEKAARAATSTSNCDHGVYRPIIKAGDTDLLLRLFDHVEPTTRSTAVRKKRGRPKCPEYVSMPPRRTGNQNSCTVDSITNKLFPKLSLDNRQTLAALTRVLPRRGPAEIIGQDVKLSNAGTVLIDNEDFPLLHQDDNVVLGGLNSLGETRALQESTPVLIERPSRLLPHLTPHKDYSQLLSELTAVL